MRWTWLLAWVGLCPTVASLAQADVLELDQNRREFRVVAPPPTPATYELRQQLAALNAPPQEESLSLPLILAGAQIPLVKHARGERLLPGMRHHLPATRYLWHRVAWRPHHEEFVRRCSTADHDDDRRALVEWCEQHEHAECAEYVLRGLLIKYQHQPRASIYQWSLARWRKLSGQRVSPFTFVPPVEGQWHVLLDTTGHHQQRHCNVWAYDLVRERDGRFFAGANHHEQHFAWRQKVVAVADGIVVAADDQWNDNPIGRSAAVEQSNYLQLDCGGGVFAYYGHLCQNSLQVRKGDRVRAGQSLALVGNSGSSDLPHLHFGMMDADGFAIRGRYRMQLWTTEGWYAVNGIDWEEGWHFRSAEE